MIFGMKFMKHYLSVMGSFVSASCNLIRSVPRRTRKLSKQTVIAMLLWLNVGRLTAERGRCRGRTGQWPCTTADRSYVLWLLLALPRLATRAFTAIQLRAQLASNITISNSNRSLQNPLKQFHYINYFYFYCITLVKVDDVLYFSIDKSKSACLICLIN